MIQKLFLFCLGFLLIFPVYAENLSVESIVQGLGYKNQKDLQDRIEYKREVIRVNEKFYAKKRYRENIQDYTKVIFVYPQKERLKYYEKGEQKGEFIISTGDANHTTPQGRFIILNKEPMAWSEPAQKWMPYFMGFYEKGKYGIHALPLDKDKQKIYEDSALGKDASGGCVRLSEQNAKNLYDWAEVGKTKVFVIY